MLSASQRVQSEVAYEIEYNFGWWGTVRRGFAFKMLSASIRVWVCN